MRPDRSNSARRQVICHYPPQKGIFSVNLRYINRTGLAPAFEERIIKVFAADAGDKLFTRYAPGLSGYPQFDFAAVRSIGRLRRQQFYSQPGKTCLERRT